MSSGIQYVHLFVSSHDRQSRNRNIMKGCDIQTLEVYLRHTELVFCATETVVPAQSPKFSAVVCFTCLSCCSYQVSASFWKIWQLTQAICQVMCGFGSMISLRSPSQAKKGKHNKTRTIENGSGSTKHHKEGTKKTHISGKAGESAFIHS